MGTPNQKTAFRTVCFTQLCERFSFFGLRALLVLYIVHFLNWGDAKAYELFAAFSMLMFIIPIFGGILTDKYIGYKKAALFGSTMICAGHLSLALFGQGDIHFGLALLTVGTGLLLPGLMNLVGLVYEDNITQQQSAYNYYYIWINTGGILAGCVIGTISTAFGWQSAFLATTLSMLMGGLFFYYYWPTLTRFAKEPTTKISTLSLIAFLLASFAVAYFLLKLHQFANIFVLLATLFGIGIFTKIYIQTKSEHKRHLRTILYLFSLSLIFFTLYEQSSGSVMLFADRIIDRHLFGYIIPTAVTSFLNPLLIIILLPMIAALWTWLNHKKLEPQVWVKMSIGIMIMSLGLFIFAFAGSLKNSGIWYLFGGITCLSMGEIFIGPVIMAAISRYAPKEHANTMMGLWWLTDAIASYAASLLAKTMTVPNENMAISSQYSNFFFILGIFGLILGLSPFILSALSYFINSERNTGYLRHLTENVVAMREAEFD